MAILPCSALASIFLLLLHSHTLNMAEGRPLGCIELPNNTSTGNLPQISASLEALDTIVVKKLSDELQRNSNEPLNMTGRVNPWQAMDLMCEEHDLLTSLWDWPATPTDPELLSIRVVYQILVKQSCQWTELLLRLDYPDRTFSLTCSDNQIGKICHDFRTVQFSRDIKDSIVAYSPSDAEDVMSTDLLPEAFELITGTHAHTSY